MKRTLDNIGGIKLVPYGGNATRLYGLGTVSAVTPTGRGRLSMTGVLVPGVRNTGYENSPLLTVDGNVFLDGAKVWSPTSQALVDGGWLGEVTTTLNIVYDNYESDDRQHVEESCSVTTLGIIPYNQAPHGCIKVTNLSFPNPDPFYRNYGTVLHPSLMEPYGDRVGEYWEANDAQERCCCLNRDNSPDRWNAILSVWNCEWKNYAPGAQDNFTVNFDGDYVPETTGSVSVEGLIYDTKTGSVSVQLSGNAGAF